MSMRSENPGALWRGKILQRIFHFTIVWLKIPGFEVHLSSAGVDQVHCPERMAPPGEVADEYEAQADRRQLEDE
jgi:hypothetical protein